jgi:hypothetical protein
LKDNFGVLGDAASMSGRSLFHLFHSNKIYNGFSLVGYSHPEGSRISVLTSIGLKLTWTNSFAMKMVFHHHTRRTTVSYLMETKGSSY